MDTIRQALFLEDSNRFEAEPVVPLLRGERPLDLVLNVRAAAICSAACVAHPTSLNALRRAGESTICLVQAARRHCWLCFVWVNEPSEMLFALKEAPGGAGTLALQCDRPQHSSRSEHLSFSAPGAVSRSRSTTFRASSSAPSSSHSAAPSGHYGVRRFSLHPRLSRPPGSRSLTPPALARGHFQSFLFAVESYLRSHPYQWLSLLPL